MRTLASSRKRATKSVSLARCGSIFLTTQTRGEPPRGVVRARKTSPIPPAPMRRRRWKRPKTLLEEEGGGLTGAVVYSPGSSLAAFMLLRSRSMALGELADLVHLQRGSAATEGRV